MRLTPMIAATVLLLLPSAACAVELGNEKEGHAYAKKVCAECHEVEGVESFSPNPDAPSFKEIANTPGMTARALAVWLQTSHPTMPDFIIPQADTDNLIAYIMSLRTPSQP